jgi:hypothetical protein
MRNLACPHPPRTWQSIAKCRLPILFYDRLIICSSINAKVMERARSMKVKRTHMQGTGGSPNKSCTKIVHFSVIENPVLWHLGDVLVSGKHVEIIYMRLRHRQQTQTHST